MRESPRGTRTHELSNIDQRTGAGSICKSVVHHARRTASCCTACQRRQLLPHDRTARVAARCAARSFAPDRHEERLRSGGVRRVHRPGRRRAHQFLPDARRSVRRSGDSRRSRDCRRTGSCTRCSSAFIEHDGFQCGYCTPGQICSAVAMLGRVRGAACRARSTDGDGADVELTDEELRERMSGNLCRCGAYVGIRRGDPAKRAERMAR